MNTNTKSLIRSYADQTATPEQLAQLEQTLRTEPTARELYLHELSLHSALEDIALGDLTMHDHPQHADLSMDHIAGIAESGTSSHLKSSITKWTIFVVAAAIVSMLMLTRRNSEPRIASVTGLSGPLQWTGDGGRVIYDIKAGEDLPGGTIEGLAPDSWFELTFRDGSKVTISGTSMLTFSDHGQKTLYLKQGNLSGHAERQPAERPMIIYTRSAMLEVLGTQFGVKAEPWSTALRVSEGSVRIKRFSDGVSIDVPANHRAVAEADAELTAVPVPASVETWSSSLAKSPVDTFGEWIPEQKTRDAVLKAVPFGIPEGRTIYAAALGVSGTSDAPIVVGPESRVRVQGRTNSPHVVYFGITVRHADGSFAGRYQTRRPVQSSNGDNGFDEVLVLDEYSLDPSLNEIQSKLPPSPVGLFVESFWCHTLFDSVGLEISNIELRPSKNATTYGDVWSAVRDGHLPAVQRLLANGNYGDINTRQPGTDATALQLAATFGHVDVAKFLIEQGADVSAKDHNGNTALHAAVFMAFPDIAVLLKNAGASPQTKNNSGESPAELVLVPWEQDLVEVYRSIGDHLGMKLDLQRIRLARPKIAEILNK